MSIVATEKPRVRVPARSALLASAAMPTIQFRGIGAAAVKPASEDEDANETEEDVTSSAEDEGSADDRPKPRKKNAAANRADASTDEGDEDGEGDEGDDDDDEESDRREARGSTPVRAARLRERGRIAAILESPAAAANLEFAVRLALTTDLPRKEAISLLQAAPKPAAGGGRQAERMDDYRSIRPGAGAVAAPKGQAAIDALWDQQAAANGFAPRRT